MPDTTGLERRLEETLANAGAARRRERKRTELQMAELARRERRLDEIAGELFARVVPPRLRLLVRHLPGAELRPSPRANHSLVELNRDRRIRASVVLEIGLTRDAPAEHLVARYHLQITPTLIDYQGHDELSLPLSNVDERAVTTFVEERIVACLETWLELQQCEEYLDAPDAVDPVCGMEIRIRDAAASAVHAGRTFYFCARVCRERFMESPGSFAARVLRRTPV